MNIAERIADVAILNGFNPDLRENLIIFIERLLEGEIQ